MDGIHEDTGDCTMQCSEHPFKNNSPAGGICAICLQEKLGKLVSSSFPITVFPSSSSSSPSFRSNISTTTTTTITTNTNTNTTNIVPQMLSNSTTQITQTNSTNCHHHQQYYSNRSRILYLIGQRKKKKKDHNIIIDHVHECNNNNNNNNMVFKRSKSSADGLRYTNMDNNDNQHHNKRGFWSFIHLHKHSHPSLSTKKAIKNISSNVSSTSTCSERKSNEVTIVVEDNVTPCQGSFDRKVSRSRSVGCGSRSFSGDFFERISTGFGDCTLRRVESQRQQKSQLSVNNNNNNNNINNNSHDSIKERVRCGGLFSGFMVTSSSSSSSSSSYWVASNHGSNGKVTSAVGGRERGWGWALASPIRAFSKQGSNKREGGSSKNQVPNINGMPSLLSVRS